MHMMRSSAFLHLFAVLIHIFARKALFKLSTISLKINLDVTKTCMLHICDPTRVYYNILYIWLFIYIFVYAYYDFSSLRKACFQQRTTQSLIPDIWILIVTVPK